MEAIRRVDLRGAAAGVALAGLVYAHHPSAFLGFPFLAIYAGAVAIIAGRGDRAAARTICRGLAVVGAAFLLVYSAERGCFGCPRLLNCVT